MNDLPRSHDDEIVSAVLDGVATDEERARVAADPELSARLEEFALVRDAVAGPVAPLDELTRRRLLDQALANAIPGVRAAPGAEAPRGGRHGAWFGGAMKGAAAAVVALALVGGLALLGQTGGDDEMAGSADDAGDEVRTFDAITGDMDAGDDGAGALDADDAGAVAWLGSFDDVEELAAAARSRAALGIDPWMADDSTEPDDTAGGVATTTMPSPGTIERGGTAESTAYSASSRLRMWGCSPDVVEQAGLDGAWVQVLEGLVDGRAVLALVGPPPDHVVVVLDAASCEIVDRD